MYPHRLTLAAALSGLLFAAACSGGAETPTSPTPGGGPDSGPVTYTVLGASDGIGYGSSIPCAPFDLGCENGTGYAQTLRRRFESAGRAVTYRNPVGPRRGPVADDCRPRDPAGPTGSAPSSTATRRSSPPAPRTSPPSRAATTPTSSDRP
ncbi:MAG: hypothetical protein R2712_30515 [Vicinamibacterales bacterium]